MTTRRMNIGAARLNDGDGHYWMGGVWRTDGRLLWSSEPESYRTRQEALDAAREAKRHLQADRT